MAVMLVVEKILHFLGTDPIVLGIATVCGIIGFVLTIFVTIKTAKINKVLKYNKVTEQYNDDRKSYQRCFDGYKTTIIEDDLKTEKILKDLLSKVEAYLANFNEIISLREKFTLNIFIRVLKKDYNELTDSDWNTICNYLAKLSGRLSKKEDQKNV